MNNSLSEFQWEIIYNILFFRFHFTIVLYFYIWKVLLSSGNPTLSRRKEKYFFLEFVFFVSEVVVLRFSCNHLIKNVFLLVQSLVSDMKKQNFPEGKILFPSSVHISEEIGSSFLTSIGSSTHTFLNLFLTLIMITKNKKILKIRQNGRTKMINYFFPENFCEWKPNENEM